MLEIKVILKNNDVLYYYTNNRHRAMQFFERYKNYKFMKVIKTTFICGKGGKK